MFTATASCNVEYDHQAKAYGPREVEKMNAFTARAVCESPEAAEELAKAFPKFVGVKVSGKWASVRIVFAANEVNGGKNEAGIKRLRKFLEIANVEFVGAESLVNYMTREEVEAFIK